MAETHPLPALSRAARRALDPRTDDDLLAEARARFRLAMDAERDERAQHREALNFRAGEHWPEPLRRLRNQPGRERPCLVIDRQAQHIDQVVNAYRRNPLGMRVRPKRGGATKAVADILEGKLRDIEQDSEADIAYTSALDQATGQGLGYFRLTLDYDAWDTFTQSPKIRPIYNRFCVYLDPAAVHPAALDAEWGFLVERWAASFFQQHYRLSATDLASWCGPEDAAWHHRGEVQVAEYFYRVWTPDTLLRLQDGRVVLQSVAGDLFSGFVEAERPTTRVQVYWVKMCGYHVLERTPWLGRYIPIVRVEGKRLDRDGQARRTGIIQASADAQLAYDFARSAEAEAIALAPKAPYLVYDEQISGYEEEWDNANDAQQPYLRIRATSTTGQLLQPPRREVAEPAVQAITQAAMLAADDIKACLGLYGPSVGEPSNERSGVAINARKIEGDATTLTYSANLAWAIRACGIQLVDLLPKLYRGPTDLRQVAKDGTVQTTRVNLPAQDAAGRPVPLEEQRLLAQGEYEVVIDSGPSYATQREMAADKLGQMGAVVPDLVKYFADLWTGALDVPFSEEIAARLKTAVPPEALAATKDGSPESQVPVLQTQLQQAAQALQLLQQQLQESQQTQQVATQQVALTEQENARLKTQLADKARDLAIETQRAKWEHQEAMEANAIKAAELRLKFSEALANQAIDQERLRLEQEAQAAVPPYTGAPASNGIAAPEET